MGDVADTGSGDHGDGPPVAARPARHLYVHVPFCAHRCGYCDFVTTAHQPDLHERYVAALIAEDELRASDTGAVGPGETAGAPLDTVFIGGGTPTLLEPAALRTLLEHLSGRIDPAGELTIECNPETVTPALAGLLVEHGVTRVSLGAQSFSPHVLSVLERRATPEVVRGAVDMLRGAGVRNLSLDLIWAVPGQSRADLRRDLRAAAALAPDHLSAYELEFKPGTRLAHAWPLGSDSDEIHDDDHYDEVVDTLGEAGYEWYETANFARDGRYARHNLACWQGRDYAGIGIGAFGTVNGTRRRNLPNLPRWLAAVEAGELPPARLEQIDAETARRERIILALRLAAPCTLDALDLDTVVDAAGLDELVALRLALVTEHGCGVDSVGAVGSLDVTLTRRGRMLLNSVLVRLLR